MADERELLRFLMAGSVDDGKSTLIGRLLHDAGAIYQDQLAALRTVSNDVVGGIDFALVTDGLRVEREQGITIDVAYRYFRTRRRKYIVADAPGHAQYTRNMATGASTASLAVLLMDAHKGARPQTHRHAAIAWLMGIRHFVVAVNKMDLIDFREDAFRELRQEFSGFLQKLGRVFVQFIPCCAPCGDNVARRSARTPWYGGPTLLEHLEVVPAAAEAAAEPFRLPVQLLLRPGNGERHYAGQIASGCIHAGDAVVALPSGQTARVVGLHVAGEPVERAVVPASVTLLLDRDIDCGRGDMLADPACPPASMRRFRATLLWMSVMPLGLDRPYLIKHTSRYVCASLARVMGVIDPVTLARRPAGSLELNEFAEVEVETHQPIYADCYGQNRKTGAFLVVDPISNETLAGGMIAGRLEAAETARKHCAAGGMAVWFTGLSSAGKSTISSAVFEKLWAKGYKVEVLDGDAVRQHLSRDLGFSKQDRDENIRRIGFLAELLVRNGVIVLVAAISPYRRVRDEIRARIVDFVEVYVNAPLEVVEQRDLKGIYRRCRVGEIRGVTGIDDPYEPPGTPEVECRTDRETVAESADKVIEEVERRISRL